jgi:hypothetical protein
MPSLVKSACPHCAGHLEFDSDDAGRETVCPHCSAPIRLVENILPLFAHASTLALPPQIPTLPPQLPTLPERKSGTPFTWLVVAASVGLAGLSLIAGWKPGEAYEVIALQTAIFLPVAVFLYSLPGMIAEARRHRNRLAIIVLNVFLGWTLIGWVCALVWGCTRDVETEPR